MANSANTPQTTRNAPAAEGKSVNEDPGFICQPILSHMRLDAIQLVAFSGVRRPRLDEKPNANLSINPIEEMNVAFHAASKRAIAVINLKIEAKDGDEIVVEINGVYRAIYGVNDSYVGDRIEDRATAFCHANALSHVWSYWREMLSSMCLRMGIPPILAPLLVVGARLPEDRTTHSKE
jgi:preprotein translocase subunit SecB